MRTLGGGELLRAVMTANAVTSNPFFYCVELTGNDGGAAPITVKTNVLQLKAASYFLMTSLFGVITNTTPSQPEFISIFDAANQRQIINFPTNYAGNAGTINNPNSANVMLFNDTLASCVTLPEYILWSPNSLVGVSWMGRNSGPDIAYRYLVLGGIEYEMKGS